MRTAPFVCRKSGRAARIVASRPVARIRRERGGGDPPPAQRLDTRREASLVARDERDREAIGAELLGSRGRNAGIISHDEHRLRHAGSDATGMPRVAGIRDRPMHLERETASSVAHTLRHDDPWRACCP